MRKFIIILIFWLGASCFPVMTSSICERSSEMISALTQSSYANAQNRMNVAILFVTVNISKLFC